MTIDQRIPVDVLHARLTDAGFTVTWPPIHHDEWRAVARRIARQEPLPPRPTVYDLEVMRTVHAADPVLARAAMRTAAGWLQAPHGDRDFRNTLDSWAAGLCLDWDDGEQHFVAAGCASFGRGRDRVDVARCKDCGGAVYSIGLEWRLRRDPDNEVTDWRPIWG